MAVYRCHIHSVAKFNHLEVATREAQRITTVLATALPDRTVLIAGDGWQITGRTQDGDGGTQVEGDFVNQEADVLLRVAPG